MLQLIIVGNLGADAVVKEANGKKFVSFNVAHTERWTDDQGVIHDTTQWVGCALSGDGGNLLQYLRKGTMIYAIGRVKTRVYSSETARGFVAGLDLSVQHIELIGGRPDDVPSRLFDQEGRQVDVSKHYWTSMANYYNTQVYDRNGKPFSIDAQGWVSQVKTEEAQAANVQTAKEDAPFEEGVDPLAQQTTNTKRKKK